MLIVDSPPVCASVVTGAVIFTLDNFCSADSSPSLTDSNALAVLTSTASISTSIISIFSSSTSFTAGGNFLNFSESACNISANFPAFSYSWSLLSTSSSFSAACINLSIRFCLILCTVILGTDSFGRGSLLSFSVMSLMVSLVLLLCCVSRCSSDCLDDGSPSTPSGNILGSNTGSLKIFLVSSASLSVSPIGESESVSSPFSSVSISSVNFTADSPSLGLSRWLGSLCDFFLTLVRFISCEP